MLSHLGFCARTNYYRRERSTKYGYKTCIASRDESGTKSEERQLDTRFRPEIAGLKETTDYLSILSARMCGTWTSVRISECMRRYSTTWDVTSTARHCIALDEYIYLRLHTVAPA